MPAAPKDEAGVEDAAILLMSLGEEDASQVLKHMTPKEVQRVGETIAKMKAIPRERVQSVIDRFTEQTAAESMLVNDNSEYVKSVLRKALGDDKANLLIDRILQGSDTSGIESLKWMDPSSVAELLRNEHPQIVAAILVHLEFDHAADTLKLFTERQRNEVMLRIATLDGIQPNALKDLNEVMSKVLAGGDRTKRKNLGGAKTAAEMLNMMGSSVETSVLDFVREADGELAQKIMDNMFTFDDLEKIDDKGFQALLKEVKAVDTPVPFALEVKHAAEVVAQLFAQGISVLGRGKLRCMGVLQAIRVGQHVGVADCEFLQLLELRGCSRAWCRDDPAPDFDVVGVCQRLDQLSRELRIGIAVLMEIINGRLPATKPAWERVQGAACIAQAGAGEDAGDSAAEGCAHVRFSIWIMASRVSLSTGLRKYLSYLKPCRIFPVRSKPDIWSMSWPAIISRSGLASCSRLSSASCRRTASRSSPRKNRETNRARAESRSTLSKRQAMSPRNRNSRPPAVFTKTIWLPGVWPGDLIRTMPGASA